MGSHASNGVRAGAPRARRQSTQAVLDGLRRVVRQLRLGAREAEKTTGISGAQLFVLEVLAEEPATSIADVAERTLTDQSSVSVVVRRLTEHKLVARTASPADARRIELRLTAAGRRLLSKGPTLAQTRLITALGRLGEPDLSSLARGLRALVREMGIEHDAPRMFFEEDAPAAAEPRRVAARRRAGAS